MAIPQTAILDTLGPMLPGMPATTNPGARVGSYRSATVEAIFGDVAFEVAGDASGFTHTVDAGAEIGIVQYSHSQSTTNLATSGDVAVTRAVNVAKSGTYWVTSTQAVTDITVPVTYAVGGKIGVGQANPLPTAKWRSVLAAGPGLVQIEINLP